MKFAINENTILQCDLFTFLDACSSCGFDAVELSYRKSLAALKMKGAAWVRERIAAVGLKVLSLNALEDALLYPTENLEVLRNEARLIAATARSVSSPAVVVPSSTWTESFGPRPSRARITAMHKECLAAIREVFREYSIEPLFEPIAYEEFVVGTPEWTNEALADPALRGMRIVPDIHNLHKNGAGPTQLRLFSSRIGLFHIDDTIDPSRDPRHVPLHVARSRTFPGEGVASAEQWVVEAAKTGYDGYYSLELFDDAIYSMGAADAARLCKAKLEDFERVARDRMERA